MLELLFVTALAALAGRVLSRALPDIVREGGNALMRPNFRGDDIPTAQGIGFVLAAALAAFAAIVLKLVGAPVGAPFLFGLLAMSVVGLLDDVVDGSESRGFRGHVGRLLSGRGVTTGMLKALFGGAAALAVSASQASSLTALVMGAAVIALSTNIVNLFDVRPGRAAKLYLAGSIGLVAAAPTLAPLLVPLSAAVAASLPDDLAARAMMGDAGANALGFALGFGVVIGTGPVLQLVVLGVLVAAHAAAEVTSLGAWIERLPIVRHIDAWGRAERGRLAGSEREGDE